MEGLVLLLLLSTIRLDDNCFAGVDVIIFSWDFEFEADDNDFDDVEYDDDVVDDDVVIDLFEEDVVAVVVFEDFNDASLFGVVAVAASLVLLDFDDGDFDVDDFILE